MFGDLLFYRFPFPGPVLPGVHAPLPPIRCHHNGRMHGHCVRVCAWVCPAWGSLRGWVGRGVLAYKIILETPFFGIVVCFGVVTGANGEVWKLKNPTRLKANIIPSSGYPMPRKMPERCLSRDVLGPMLLRAEQGLRIVDGATHHVRVFYAINLA